MTGHPKQNIEINPAIAGIKYAIRDIVLPAKELEKAGKKILYLNIGDPLAYDFTIPEHFRMAAKNAFSQISSGYSDSLGVLPLREALVTKERTVNNLELSPENIIITNGVSEGIRMVLSALLNPQDDILVPGPGYPPYQAITSMVLGNPVSYATVSEDNWQPDIDDLRKKITDKTKAIVIITPNNPTGAVYSEKTLKAICDLAGEADIPIISDEIYDQLVYEGHHISTGSIASDIPVIGLNGLSKCYLLPGWRIGYIYLHGPDSYFGQLREGLAKQARIRLCAATPLQYAAANGLNQPQTHLKPLRDTLKSRRNLFVKRINEIEGLSCNTPAGAMYIFPEIDIERIESDKKFAMDLLTEQGVLVVHGSGFDALYGANHFRIVTLPPPDIIELACDKIERFMRKYQ